MGKIPWSRKWKNHSSILAWRIPWTEEPGGLQSSGLQRVRHDWMTNTCTLLHIYYICNIHLLYPFICWWTLTLFLKSPLQWITLQWTWGCRYLSKTDFLSFGGYISGLIFNPLQYSCLENSMDRGAWRTIVHGIPLSNWAHSTHRDANSLHKADAVILAMLPFPVKGTKVI